MRPAQHRCSSKAASLRRGKLRERAAIQAPGGSQQHTPGASDSKPRRSQHARGPVQHIQVLRGRGACRCCSSTHGDRELCSRQSRRPASGRTCRGASGGHPGHHGSEYDRPASGEAAGSSRRSVRLQRCNSMAKRHPQRTFQAENLAWATLGLRVAVYIDAGRSLCHGRGGPTR